MYPYNAAWVFDISADRKGPGEPAHPRRRLPYAQIVTMETQRQVCFLFGVNMTTLAHIDVYELETDMISVDIRTVHALRSLTCALYEFVGVQTYAC